MACTIVRRHCVTWCPLILAIVEHLTTKHPIRKTKCYLRVWLLISVCVIGSKFCTLKQIISLESTLCQKPLILGCRGLHLRVDFECGYDLVI